MKTQHNSEYVTLLNGVIKKLLVVLGPDITFSKLHQISGLSITENGVVTEVTTDPRLITHQLKDKFLELSGFIVSNTITPLEKYAMQFSSVIVNAENNANTPAPHLLLTADNQNPTQLSH